MKKKIKIYCYVYDIKGQHMYVNDLDVSGSGPVYVGHDEDDEAIVVLAEELDHPRLNEAMDRIMVPTLVNDVNRAMELMNKTLKALIKRRKTELKTLQAIQTDFSIKQKEVKEKFPTGKKEMTNEKM